MIGHKLRLGNRNPFGTNTHSRITCFAKVPYHRSEPQSLAQLSLALSRRNGLLIAASIRSNSGDSQFWKIPSPQQTVSRLPWERTTHTNYPCSLLCALPSFEPVSSDCVRSQSGQSPGSSGRNGRPRHRLQGL
jgi:hypothetical protein